MRYERGDKRGGRCRVRGHYIGKWIDVRNPRERKRDMQKRIVIRVIRASYSFSRQIHAKYQAFGQSRVTFVKNSRKTLARTDPRNSVG